uniref:Acetyl-coenzyme A carboxylase carboxyl transferase subunit beta, chloroplastic n=1 Tax=Lonicera rupicola var. syringantha TaxID=447674 RepID=A0A977IVE5_9DIPS|nr:acetyl-CoA carboxylase carboxyltransferase beta subunit [Lonicera rupicola var. syringantha]
MKKNNLHSAVFFRHQGGYSLKKLWFHLMLLDFGRGCGLSQTEEDPLRVRAKVQADSESDPEEHNHNPFHDSELAKLFEAMRLPLHRYFPKDDPNDRQKIKAFLGEFDYHLEIFFSGEGFRDFEGGLRGKEKAIAMIRAVIYKYFPNGDPSATKDPEKKKKFDEEVKDIVERYNNGDPRFIADSREKVKEEIRLELNELYAKYFPKDDPGAKKDKEKIDKYFKEAFRIVERYPKDPSYGSDPDGPDSGSDTDGPDSGSDTDGPDSGSDTDGPDSGSDTDGPGYEGDPYGPGYEGDPYGPGSGSDTDDPGYEGDPYGPGSGSDTDDPGYEGDPELIEKLFEAIEADRRYREGYSVALDDELTEEILRPLYKNFPKDAPNATKDREKIKAFYEQCRRMLESCPDDSDYGSDPYDPDYGRDLDDPDYGTDLDDPDYGYGSHPDHPDYGRYPYDPDSGSDLDDPDYGSDPDGDFYGYGNDPDALESDPEYYLQKKRNPGGDYLQIDRYPEDTCFKIERDPQKIDRYIEEPYLDNGSNPQKDDPSYGGDPQEDDSDSGSDPNPRENYTHKYKHLWLMCDECYTLNYRRFLNERLYTCEGCGFHLKMNSSERLKLLIDPDTWDPMNEKMASLDPIEFHSEEDPYIDRVNSYQKKTGLTEAIQTGLGQLNGIPIAMGVMEFGFMGGSMGSVVGEKITRLVEYATNQSLPLIIVCASGGARMQEGSLSLMQMAKISSSLYDFQTNKKLFYVSILTSPTTGGVTASFGMLGDVIFAEPDAYIAFAGKRVIELTLNKEVPEGSQETEYLFEKGLFDVVVPRKNLKSTLNKLFGSHGFFPLTLNQNHSSITEH